MLGYILTFSRRKSENLSFSEQGTFRHFYLVASFCWDLIVPRVDVRREGVGSHYTVSTTRWEGGGGGRMGHKKTLKNKVDCSVLGLHRFLIFRHRLALIRGLIRVDVGVTPNPPEVLMRDGIAGVRVRDVILVDVVVLELLPSVVAVAAIDDVC